MKIVDVPGDVTATFKSPTGPVSEVIAFKAFLVHQMDTFESVKTREQIRQADKIVRLIEGSNGHISLEDADYAVLDDACREIRYVPEVKRQLLPFIDALEKARVG